MVALSLPVLTQQARSSKSPLLHPAPFGQGEEVLSLNLARGCLHRCAFCSARAFSSYPGDDLIYLYNNVPERLDDELKRRVLKPRAVYLSPATDPFPPHLQMQTVTARVVEILARHGVESWLMTRGHIRPTPLELIEPFHAKVRLTVGLTSLDRSLQRVLEPLAAPPRMRLRQIGALKRRGWNVQVALEPLVPGVTDARANLFALLEALARLGVKQVTAGYMFLRSGIEENVRKALKPLKLDRKVLDSYTGGPVMRGDNVAPARYLPRGYRQQGYARLVALGAELGVTVKVSGVTNPDFTPTRAVRPAAPLARQPLLPMF